MRHTLLSMLLVTPALAGTPQLAACIDSPTPIPDDAPAGLLVHLDLGPPNGLAVGSIQLELTVDHPWVGDLHATLTAPDGTSVILIDRPGLVHLPAFDFPGPHGCGGDNIDAIFTDATSADAQSTCSVAAVPVLAGPLRPAQALAAFEGLPASGVWTLTIADLGPTDAGALTAACLRLDTRPACPADLAASYGVLNFFDVAAYLGLYNAQLPGADWAPPAGILNFFDLAAYLASYNAGCS
jgi:subtilisin-like proprotein convertase family protein